MYHIYLFANDKTYLHPWNKSHLIMLYDFYYVFLDLVCYILLRIFHLHSLSKLWLLLFFFIVSVCFWYQEGPCRMNLQAFYLLQFFWNSLGRMGINYSWCIQQSFPGCQKVKNLPATAGDMGPILGWKDPLRKK